MVLRLTSRATMLLTHEQACLVRKLGFAEAGTETGRVLAVPRQGVILVSTFLPPVLCRMH